METDLDLAKLPRSERDKHHRKQLRSIQQYQGLEGVRAYKQKHPEASPIRVFSNPIAYSPAPKGYDAALIDLAEKWLTDGAALAKSNVAEVQGLNAKLGTERFNPTNHFSKPLSPSRLAKIKAAFLKHGIPLDTERNNTLSKLKAVVKAARGRQSADRPFGQFGVISGNALIVGDRSIAIGQHHDRDCIRVPVNGARVWLRLDVLEAAINLLNGGMEAEEKPLLSPSTSRIGELVPKPENPDVDPSAADEMGESVPVSISPLPLGEVVPEPTDPPSLTSRISALKLAASPHSTTYADGIDPLNL